MAACAHFPYEDLEFAKVDHHRELRTGVPEVVYAPGKTHEQLARERPDAGGIVVPRLDHPRFA